VCICLHVFQVQVVQVPLEADWKTKRCASRNRLPGGSTKTLTRLNNRQTKKTKTEGRMGRSVVLAGATACEVCVRGREEARREKNEKHFSCVVVRHEPFIPRYCDTLNKPIYM